MHFTSFFVLRLFLIILYDLIILYKVVVNQFLTVSHNVDTVIAGINYLAPIN